MFMLCGNGYITQFLPDKHTAIICFQVLKAAIYQIGTYRYENR